MLWGGNFQRSAALKKNFRQGVARIIYNTGRSPNAAHWTRWLRKIKVTDTHMRTHAKQKEINLASPWPRSSSPNRSAKSRLFIATRASNKTFPVARSLFFCLHTWRTFSVTSIVKVSSLIPVKNSSTSPRLCASWMQCFRFGKQLDTWRRTSIDGITSLTALALYNRKR